MPDTCKTQQFKTRTDALVYVNGQRMHQGSLKLPTSIRFYPCQRCGKWHWTKQERRVKNV